MINEPADDRTDASGDAPIAQASAGSGSRPAKRTTDGARRRSGPGNLSWSEGGPEDRPKPRNAMPIAATVFGVVAILALLVVSQVVLGILFGVIAVVLGILGLRQVRRGVADRRALALTGIITGALAVVLSVVLLILSYKVYKNCEHKIGHKPSVSELKGCGKN